MIYIYICKIRTNQIIIPRLPRKKNMKKTRKEKKEKTNTYLNKISIDRAVTTINSKKVLRNSDPKLWPSFTPRQSLEVELFILCTAWNSVTIFDWSPLMLSWFLMYVSLESQTGFHSELNLILLLLANLITDPCEK